jgi:hypothetical protein
MDRNQVARELVKVAKDLVGGDKVYYEQYGIGKTKYSVSYHNGKSTHNDGSDFYDIALFSNKKALARFIKDLKSQGYKERGINLAADITMAKDLVAGNEQVVGGVQLKRIAEMVDLIKENNDFLYKTMKSAVRNEDFVAPHLGTIESVTRNNSRWADIIKKELGMR